MMPAMIRSDVSPQDRKAARTGRLAWPLAAAIIGLLSMAAWLLIIHLFHVIV
jgi:hypothetical protein